MLDNSFGRWSEFYTRGAEATWVNRIKKDDFYLRYIGKRPKIEALNALLNRGLNSRFQNTVWKYQLITGWKPRRESKLISDSVIQINCSEIWSNVTAKTISAIDFALQNFDFDYIVRGNSSLYVDPSLLEAYLESNTADLDYAGPIIGGKKFVAGWCIILSRRAAEIVVSDFRKSDSLYFDDEAIGLILARNNINPHLVKYTVFDNIPSISEIEGAISTGTWIWRFKTDVSGIRISVPAMNLVENYSKESGDWQ